MDSLKWVKIIDSTKMWDIFNNPKHTDYKGRFICLGTYDSEFCIWAIDNHDGVYTHEHFDSVSDALEWLTK